jgi:hypothetical protein
MVAALALAGTIAEAQQVAPLRVSPNALSAIDQNRATVVDRIVANWGDALVQSGVVLSPDQLREVLNGLRADHLLAASLAGTLSGLRDVLANALTTTAAVQPGRVQAKALGDSNDDLVYTPVVPCRILDTRNGTVPPYNAQLIGGIAFPVAANLANFGPQGGSASNCGLPASFSAVMVTFTVLNPNFDAFMAASNTSNFATLTQSVVMDFSANRGLANTATVPVDGTEKFYLGLPAAVTTHVIADIAGYFKRAVNSSTGAFEVALNGSLALQIVPDPDSPIVIAGSNANAVTSGASGAAIGGGGKTGTEALSYGCGSSQNCANRVTDAFGTIGGGVANQAGDNAGTAIDRGFATVGGGIGNTASGIAATVSGGIANTASESYATVVGGYVNTAVGYAATVVGGFDNYAGGTNSLAAGAFAHADQDRCFVFANWSIFPSSPMSCLGTKYIARFGLDHGLSVDYFSARADGGGNRWVAIGDTIAGQTIGTWTGASLTNTGVWTNNSDVNQKTGFETIDPAEVLANVASMPITRWRYLNEDVDKRHIGPMAQDFWAAFGLGDDDKHIGTIDESGVALAAIQGLYQVMKETDARLQRAFYERNRRLDEQAATIRAQQHELAELKEQVQNAQSLASDVLALKAALAELWRTQDLIAGK